jgi:undecaprenyl-diphosphatase
MARSLGSRIAIAGAGAALVVGTGVAAARGLDERETAVFRFLNDVPPDGLRRLNWAVMLGGTYWAVPSAAAAAAYAGRPRLAVALAAGGTASYLLAKAIKPIVGRDRPGGLLSDVTFRDEIGGNRGWVSGHAAVSTTLAMTAWPSLPPVGRVTVTVAAVGVDLGRMYAGAHLPLDVAGGLGLGMLVAAAIPDAGRG